MDGATHGAQLMLCLDAPRAFGNFLTIAVLQARAADRVKPCWLNLVNADLLVAWCVTGKQVCDLGSKGIGRRTNPITTGKIEHICTRTAFAHQRIEFCKEWRILVIPKYHVAIGTK